MIQKQKTMRMKRLIILPILILSIIVGNAAFAADFEKGWDTYNDGDYAAALNEWQPLAEQGDADAQFNLGWMYDEGFGVAKDAETAFIWYLRAAELSHISAQYNVAWMYEKGSGVAQDVEAAFTW